MKMRAKTCLITLMIVLAVAALNLSAAFAAEQVSYEQYLIQSLKDENIGRRASAAMILGDQKSTEAIQPLFALLKSENDYRVRIVAAMSLYKIGDPNILPVLEGIAKKEKNKTAKQVMYGIIAELRNTKYAVK